MVNGGAGGATRTISGDEAKALIESQLAAHGNGVLSVLAQYRREDAVAAWHETIRAVEEFINLVKFGIADDQLRTWTVRSFRTRVRHGWPCAGRSRPISSRR